MERSYCCWWDGNCESAEHMQHAILDAFKLLMA